MRNQGIVSLMFEKHRGLALAKALIYGTEVGWDTQE